MQFRNSISSGLKNLFDNELIPIIERYNLHNCPELEEETKWRMFEGAIEEVLHRIRLYIAVKLNRDPEKMYLSKPHKLWINQSI